MQTNKVLLSLIRYNNVVMPKKVFIETLKSEGKTAHIRETPKYQYNRQKFNSMDNARQEEYELKLKETKMAYYVGNYEVSKTEYDYFHTL